MKNNFFMQFKDIILSYNFKIVVIFLQRYDYFFNNNIKINKIFIYLFELNIEST